ncbi:MAG: hypothetical protein HOQ03_06520, partial [Thermoleophilia bacterium]|nr:hypothetical protein [Thermoleophilia bacterium]
MTALSPQQYQYLLQPLNPKRVGKNAKGFAHMEAWDIRRHLTRIFGFGGWDDEILTTELVAQVEYPPQTQTGRPRWTVVYRSSRRLTVRCPDGTTLAIFEASACGDSTNQPSLGDAHDNALKTAESQALKRCAINLGDQFGLSLYDGESVDAVMIATLVPVEQTEPVPAPPEMPVTDVKPEPGSEEIHGRSVAETPPPAPAEPAEPMVTQDHHKHMHALWNELGYGGQENR